MNKHSSRVWSADRSEKRCTCCTKFKPVSEYNPHKRDGVRPRCRECQNADRAVKREELARSAPVRALAVLHRGADGVPVLTQAQFKLLVNKGQRNGPRGAALKALREQLVTSGYFYCSSCAAEGSLRCHPLDNIQHTSGRPLPQCRRHHNAMTYAFSRANPEVTLLSNARARAERDGVPFTITTQDVRDALDASGWQCPVLGLELKWMGGDKAPNSVTLDRLVPALGYTPANIQILSSKANTAKSNLGVEHIIKLAAFYSQPIPAQQNEVFGPDVDQWRMKAWASMGSRCRKYGRARTIVRDDIKAAKQCPCCGIELDYRRGKGLGKVTRNSPSIDRVDNGSGYLVGNIATICHKCNTGASTLDAAELFVLAEWLSIELTARGHQCPHRGAALFAQHYTLPLAA